MALSDIPFSYRQRQAETIQGRIQTVVNKNPLQLAQITISFAILIANSCDSTVRQRLSKTSPIYLIKSCNCDLNYVKVTISWRITGFAIETANYRYVKNVIPEMNSNFQSTLQLSQSSLPIIIITIKMIKKIMPISGFILLIAIFILVQRVHCETLYQKAKKITQAKPTHSKPPSQFCQGTEGTLITPQERALSKYYGSKLRKAVGIDGKKLLATYLVDIFNHTSVASAQFKQNSFGLYRYIGFQAIGLPLCIIACIFAWTRFRSPTAYLQKNDTKIEYSKNQVQIPIALLLGTLIITIIVAEYGYYKAPQSNKGINNLFCSLMSTPQNMIPDDISNFGLVEYAQFLQHYQQSLTKVHKMATNLSEGNKFNISFIQLLQKGEQVLQSMKIISDGGSGGPMHPLQYPDPINAKSIFPQILGTYNSSGLIFDLYKLLQKTTNSLQHISNLSKSIRKEIPQLNRTLQQFRQAVMGVHILTTHIQKQIQKYLGISKVLNFGTTVTRFFFGFIIVCCLAAIGTIVYMFKYDKYEFQYLLYFIIIFLAMMCLISFTLSTVYSTLLPVMNWGCEFIQFSLYENEANKKIGLGRLNQWFQEYTGHCLSFGDGNLTASFNGIAMTKLSEIATNFTTFSNVNSKIYTEHTSELLNTINSYGLSQTNDIPSSFSLSPFTKIASPTSKEYIDCASDNPHFASDSFVPSVNQNPEYVKCNIPGNIKSYYEECGNHLIISTEGKCRGCIDIAQVFHDLKTKEDVLFALNGDGTINGGRYPQRSCRTFSSDLANLWESYFLIKQNKIGSTLFASSNVYQRALVASSKVKQFENQLSPFLPIFKSLNSQISDLLAENDPQLGFFAKINCKLLFGYLYRNIDTVCVTTFNSLYETRRIVSLCAYSLLFTLFLMAEAVFRVVGQHNKKCRIGYNPVNSGTLTTTNFD